MIRKPESLRRAIDEWAGILSKELWPGAYVVVEWTDAADERQVVNVRERKVRTPVISSGIFYGIVAGHLCLIGHVFSGKWKNMTYIPVAIVDGVKVESDEREKASLMGEKTWSGHQHTRKAPAGKAEARR